MDAAIKIVWERTAIQLGGGSMHTSNSMPRADWGTTPYHTTPPQELVAVTQAIPSGEESPQDFPGQMEFGAIAVAVHPKPQRL